MMDFSSSSGYGYSVWFVPNCYKEIQEHYNITHIPHITLETNLSIKDAFHIYHNHASKKIIMKFKEDFVKFPSFYQHDPMMYYGWYVDILQMTGRKVNWSPHMTVCYIPRNRTNNVIVAPHQPPPMGPIECFMTIADTRSGVPSDWHIEDTYFNIKASQSFVLSFDTQSKHSRLLKNGIDEYIGTNWSQLETLPRLIKEKLMSCGVVLNNDELSGIVMEIINEMMKSRKHQGTNDAMDVDVRVKTL